MLYEPDDLPLPRRDHPLAASLARHPCMAWSVGPQNVRDYLHRTLAVEEISKYDLSSCYQRYGGPLERLKPKPDREATK